MRGKKSRAAATTRSRQKKPLIESRVLALVPPLRNIEHWVGKGNGGNGGMPRRIYCRIDTKILSTGKETNAPREPEVLSSLGK